MEQSSMTRESFERSKEQEEQNLTETLQDEHVITARQLSALNEGYDFSPYGDNGDQYSDFSSIKSFNSDVLYQGDNDKGDNNEGGNHKSDSDQGDNEGGQGINVSQDEEGLPEASQDSTEPASNRSFTTVNTSILCLKVLKYLVKALSGDDEQEYDDYD